MGLENRVCATLNRLVPYFTYVLEGKEHWLGLENIYRLTSRSNHMLRVHLVDINDKEGFGYYDGFLLVPKVIKL